jgi:hypothetical protein
MSFGQMLEELPKLTSVEKRELIDRARALIQAEAEAEAIAISEVSMQDGIEAENEARRTR